MWVKMITVSAKKKAGEARAGIFSFLSIKFSISDSSIEVLMNCETGLCHIVSECIIFGYSISFLSLEILQCIFFKQTLPSSVKPYAITISTWRAGTGTVTDIISKSTKNAIRYSHAWCCLSRYFLSCLTGEWEYIFSVTRSFYSITFRYTLCFNSRTVKIICMNCLHNKYAKWLYESFMGT